MILYDANTTVCVVSFENDGEFIDVDLYSFS